VAVNRTSGVSGNTNHCLCLHVRSARKHCRGHGVKRAVNLPCRAGN